MRSRSDNEGVSIRIHKTDFTQPKNGSLSSGSFYPVPHGTAFGIAIPYAMEHNVVTLANRLKLIAEAIGEDIAGLSEREAAYKGIYAIRSLIEDVGLPTTLKDIGVKKRIHQSSQKLW